MLRRLLLLGGVSLAAAGFTSNAHAAWPPNPAVNLPVSTGPGEQYLTYWQPMIPDGSGGVLVVYQDSRSGNFDIYVQHILASGVADPSWPAGGLLVCGVAGDQSFPSIAPDAFGGAIVAWSDRRNGVDTDVYAQRVLLTGVVAPGWPANGRALSVQPGDQGPVTLQPDGTGGGMFAWTDSRSGTTKVYVQRVQANGIVHPGFPVDGLAVAPGASAQRFPSMLEDGTGAALVFWADRVNGVDDDIYAMRVRLDGSYSPDYPAGGRLICTAPNNQLYPLAVPDGSGGAMVIWQDFRNGAHTDIYAHHLQANGVVDPTYPANGRGVCTLAGYQSRPYICTDGAGGALVASYDGRNFGLSGVYVQHLLWSGQEDPSWPANGVTLTTATGEVSPGGAFFREIVPDGAGGAVTAWSTIENGNWDVYAQRVRSNGVLDPAWPAGGVAVSTAPGTQAGPMLVPDGTGGAIIAWGGDERSDASGDLYMQRVPGSGSLGPPFVDAGVTLPPLDRSDAAFADYDEDGDLDLLMAGRDSLGARRSYLMRNDGGTFVDAGAGLPGIDYASVDWGDYDNDGDLDIALAGAVGGFAMKTTRIYRNDGGTFVDIVAGLPGVSRGVVAWGDVDNDADLDLLVAGEIVGSLPPEGLTRVYRNHAGTFVDMVAGLVGVQGCSADWGDYDGDGDFDLAIAGYEGPEEGTRVYRNDGGTLVEAAMAFQGVSNGTVAFADRDADGDLDLLLTGYDGSVGFCYVLDNNGDTFVSVGPALAGIHSGGGEWGDYDNDGDLDFAVSGLVAGLCATRVHRNDGDAFPSVGQPLAGAYTGPATWGDYDGDGDLDLLVMGQDCAFRWIVKLYRNDWGLPNAPPSPPSSPMAVRDGDDVTFTWTAPSDDHTPSGGLTYELSVSPPGGAPLHRATRVVAANTGTTLAGSITGRTSWTLSLPPGGYYWNVRAIDGALRSSAPAATTVAVEPGDVAAAVRFGLHSLAPNPFTADASISYALEKAGSVRVTVNDLQGRRVRVLDQGEKVAGRHQIRWDGASDGGVPQPSGIYWVRLESGGMRSTKKLVRVAR